MVSRPDRQRPAAQEVISPARRALQAEVALIEKGCPRARESFTIARSVIAVRCIAVQIVVTKCVGILYHTRVRGITFRRRPSRPSRP